MQERRTVRLVTGTTGERTKNTYKGDKYFFRCSPVVPVTKRTVRLSRIFSICVSMHKEKKNIKSNLTCFSHYIQSKTQNGEYAISGYECGRL